MSDDPKSPEDVRTAESSKKPSAICQHLGIANDPHTYFQFALTWNYCHRPDAIQPLPPGVQGQYCLNASHVNCPEFREDWDGRFPPEWVARTDEPARNGFSGSGPWRTMQTGVMFFMVVTLLALLFGFILPSLFSPDEISLPAVAGPEDGYVIHVVVIGESYLSIANRYGTTPEVIQAVNPTIEGASLWVDDRLVVPIGAADVDGLPIFTTLLTSEDAGLAALAESLGSDVELLRYDNLLGEADFVPAGRWLIIPLVEV